MALRELAFAAGTQGCFADSTAATVPVEKLFAAINAGSGVRLNETYAPDAVIVDNFPPFVWRGPSAPAAFWKSFLAIRKANNGMQSHATHRPLEFLRYDEAKNIAYVVAPTTVTLRVPGQAVVVTGQWIFVVKNIRGTWLIENSSWAPISYSHG